MIDLNLDIPEDFYNAEVRNDYYVSSDMKKVWAVELDLLAELLRVCKKYDIKIFASGGTMLGAVRHSGFIPWDDDIDMMMFREDYERLCEISKNEFKEPYFFQTEYTDPGSLRGHAQLRNSKTTAILENELGNRYFNQGIFIDVFPLDAVTDNEDDFNKQGVIATKYLNRAKYLSRFSTRVPRNGTGIKYKIKYFIKLLFGYWIKKYEIKSYNKFEKTCQMYNNVITEKVSTLSFQFFNKQHFKYKQDFEKLVELPFEFMTIPVGMNFDHALRCRYGEYTVFDKGKSVHGRLILSTDRPYTDYLQ